MRAIIARFWPIATNLSPEIVARKLVAVKVMPLLDRNDHHTILLASYGNRTENFVLLKGSTGRQFWFTQQNDFTESFRVRQETNLRRLKQRLFQFDFPENP